MGKDDGVFQTEEQKKAQQGGVAVLRVGLVDSSALTAAARRAFDAALTKIEQRDDICAIVITGAGADFATGTGGTGEAATDAPDLVTLCDRLEASNKPVVAAIAGAALGGGLELALAAHLRVARSDARLGSPEITLGMVPGAGGTQRLPKVVGGVAALKLLLSGRAVSGRDALSLGLVDAIDDGELLETAVAHAARLSESFGELRRSSTRRDRLGQGTDFLEAIASHRRVAEQSPLDAPLRMIECVEAALLLPYDVGRGLEQVAHEDLAESDHAKSLRHVFAAERRLKASSLWEGRVPSRPLTTLAVVGAAGVGSELAVICLDAGFQIYLVDESDAALEEGVTRIIEHYDARVASGSLTEDQVEALLDRMNAASGYRTVSNVDLVIDHSARMTTSRLKALDSAMRAGAVLAVSAEGVSLANLAKQTERPADVVGLRMFPGLRKNRLAEICETEETGAKASATVRALARKLDRLLIETGAMSDGIGTRLAEAVHAAADLSVEDGASIGQVDAALRDWGLPFGSFAWRDIVGVGRPSAPLQAVGLRGGGIDGTLAAAGRHGISVGRGYFTYTQRGRPGVLDPEVTALVDEDRRTKGTTDRKISDGDIRKRVVAAMAGAGAQMLSDGTARRPDDIDMVAIHGLGFARRTGGVMFAADLLGLDIVSDLLTRLAPDAPRMPSAGGLLQELIENGQSFRELNG